MMKYLLLLIISNIIIIFIILFIYSKYIYFLLKFFSGVKYYNYLFLKTFNKYILFKFNILIFNKFMFNTDPVYLKKVNYFLLYDFFDLFIFIYKKFFSFLIKEIYIYNNQMWLNFFFKFFFFKTFSYSNGYQKKLNIFYNQKENYEVFFFNNYYYEYNFYKFVIYMLIYNVYNMYFYKYVVLLIFLKKNFNYNNIRILFFSFFNVEIFAFKFLVLDSLINLFLKNYYNYTYNNNSLWLQHVFLKKEFNSNSNFLYKNKIISNLSELKNNSLYKYLYKTDFFLNKMYYITIYNNYIFEYFEFLLYKKFFNYSFFDFFIKNDILSLNDFLIYENDEDSFFKKIFCDFDIDFFLLDSVTKYELVDFKYVQVHKNDLPYKVPVPLDENVNIYNIMLNEVIDNNFLLGFFFFNYNSYVIFKFLELEKYEEEFKLGNVYRTYLNVRSNFKLISQYLDFIFLNLYEYYFFIFFYELNFYYINLYNIVFLYDIYIYYVYLYLNKNVRNFYFDETVFIFPYKYILGNFFCELTSLWDYYFYFLNEIYYYSYNYTKNNYFLYKKYNFLKRDLYCYNINKFNNLTLKLVNREQRWKKYILMAATYENMSFMNNLEFYLIYNDLMRHAFLVDQDLYAYSYFDNISIKNFSKHKVINWKFFRYLDVFFLSLRNYDFYYNKNTYHTYLDGISEYSNYTGFYNYDKFSEWDNTGILFYKFSGSFVQNFFHRYNNLDFNVFDFMNLNFFNLLVYNSGLFYKSNINIDLFLLDYYFEYYIYMLKCFLLNYILLYEYGYYINVNYFQGPVQQFLNEKVYVRDSSYNNFVKKFKKIKNFFKNYCFEFSNFENIYFSFFGQIYYVGYWLQFFFICFFMFCDWFISSFKNFFLLKKFRDNFFKRDTRIAYFFEFMKFGKIVDYLIFTEDMDGVSDFDGYIDSEFQVTSEVLKSFGVNGVLEDIDLRYSIYRTDGVSNFFPYMTGGFFSSIVYIRFIKDCCMLILIRFFNFVFYSFEYFFYKIYQFVRLICLCVWLVIYFFVCFCNFLFKSIKLSLLVICKFYYDKKDFLKKKFYFYNKIYNKIIICFFFISFISILPFEIIRCLFIYFYNIFIKKIDFVFGFFYNSSYLYRFKNEFVFLFSEKKNIYIYIFLKFIFYLLLLVTKLFIIYYCCIYFFLNYENTFSLFNEFFNLNIIFSYRAVFVVYSIMFFILIIYLFYPLKIYLYMWKLRYSYLIIIFILWALAGLTNSVDILFSDFWGDKILLKNEIFNGMNFYYSFVSNPNQEWQWLNELRVTTIANNWYNFNIEPDKGFLDFLKIPYYEYYMKLLKYISKDYPVYFQNEFDYLQDIRRKLADGVNLNLNFFFIKKSYYMAIFYFYKTLIIDALSEYFYLSYLTVFFSFFKDYIVNTLILIPFKIFEFYLTSFFSYNSVFYIKYKLFEIFFLLNNNFNFFSYYYFIFISHFIYLYVNLYNFFYIFNLYGLSVNFYKLIKIFNGEQIYKFRLLYYSNMFNLIRLNLWGHYKMPTNYFFNCYRRKWVFYGNPDSFFHRYINIPQYQSHFFNFYFGNQGRDLLSTKMYSYGGILVDFPEFDDKFFLKKNVMPEFDITNYHKKYDWHYEQLVKRYNKYNLKNQVLYTDSTYNQLNVSTVQSNYIRLPVFRTNHNTAGILKRDLVYRYYNVYFTKYLLPDFGFIGSKNWGVRWDYFSFDDSVASDSFYFVVNKRPHKGFIL